MTNTKIGLKYRTGKIQVTEFINTIETEGEKQEISSFKVEKNYTDKEGNWQKTNNYQLNDIPKLTSILMKIYADKMVKKVD